VTALAVQAGTHIQMRIQVNNADRPRPGRVAQVMTESCLMAAAQDYRNAALMQNSMNNFAQCGLGLLQTPTATDVAHVQRVMISEINVVLGIPGCESIQALADFVGRLSSSRPTVIAPNPFVLWKAYQNCLALTKLGRFATPIFDNVAQAQVVGAMEEILRRSGRLKPRKPLDRA
jgi:hypothetical protein